MSITLRTKLPSFRLFISPSLFTHGEFQDWLTEVEANGADLMSHDPFLKRFIKQKQTEIEQVAVKSQFSCKRVRR
jgi:hypothetical protein